LLAALRSREGFVPEKMVKVPFPNPNSPLRDGFEVGVSESTEKWSEVTLLDGTILRIRPSVISAIRIDGEYDADGNPGYMLKAQPTVVIVSSPEHLRRGKKDSKIN
jgi:hypothetical protein